ncbi:MAG TPA: ABC transporter ATP-binding protein [Herpetosiphonaceae bacterium]
MDAIVIEGLHKAYDTLPVLRSLNLRVGDGQIYGLLGPNGAGKSTLIHLMMGFLRPDQGRIEILGKAPNAAHHQVGYLPERLRYHTHCTGREYLQYFGQIGGQRGPTLKERAETLLKLVNLEDAADRRMKTYSKGMLQRIGIAQALLSDPELLLIDEPSSGLDPAGQAEIQELLRELRQRGHTIFLCSHQLDEITTLCDRVGILLRGELAAEAQPGSLPGHGGVTVTVEQEPGEELDFALRALDPSISRDGRHVTLPHATTALQSQLLRVLLDQGLAVESLQPTVGTLRDLYLHVVAGKQPPAEATPRTPAPILETLLADEEPEA